MQLVEDGGHGGFVIYDTRFLQMVIHVGYDRLMYHWLRRPGIRVLPRLLLTEIRTRIVGQNRLQNL